MSKLIALLLPSLAQSLALSRDHAVSAEEDDGLCDAEAFNKARQAGSDWKALKGNPCLSEQDYKALESGELDPEDIGEFLGENSLANFAEVDPVPVKEYDDHKDDPLMWPQVQFIGLPHSGSTSLAKQLALHPELSYGLCKEHNMIFNLGKVSNGKLKKAYLSKFALRNTSEINDAGAKYTFDASPGTMFIGCPDDERMLEFPIGKKYGTGAKAVRKVKDFLGPDTKYIVMLRDPLDWQVSDAYGQIKKLEHLMGTTKKGPGLDNKRSCYADCLESWVNVVGKNKMLFLASEQYFKDPQAVLTQIFKFLHVAPRQYTHEELGLTYGRRRAAAKESYFKTSDRKVYWQDPHVKECKARLAKLTGRGWHWGP